MKTIFDFLRILGLGCCLALLVQVEAAPAVDQMNKIDQMNKVDRIDQMDQPASVDWGPLSVHFDQNKSGLSEADRTKIRDLLERYDLGGAGRIFVVGYTDSTGARTFNYNLSRRRARQVRRSIISITGIDPGKIITVGRGPENPVGDNTRKKGRANNRRAEIYLSGAVNRELRNQYGQDDPQLETIDTLIEQAGKKMRRNNLPDALSDLQKARAVGGDRYSRWHSLYAIAGFLADAPLQKVRAHLQTALQLDKGNAEARDFLGRVEAREKVAAGQVTPAMGRSAADAIAVISLPQQYEYLALFGVEPHCHHELDGTALEVWEGSNRQQEPVAYYFDRSRVLAWQFGADPAEAASLPGPSASRTSPKPVETGRAVAALDEAPQVWQSRVFK
ncbi:MAG: OmpA family protein [Desulfosarcinaceae bacterium]